ncbi:hypothetical protein SLE2022_021520 [Rubroshorea leprosula]
MWFNGFLRFTFTFNRVMSIVVNSALQSHEISPEQNHKFIEFYNVRAAEAALCALNKCDIAGKQIKIEPSPPGGVRRFMQLSDQGQDESSNLCQSSLDDLMARHMARVSASGYMDDGSSLILHDVIWSPVNTFIGPSQSSSVPINLPSPARVASVNNQFNLQEPNHTLDVMKFWNQCITSFHPHSSPEYHDNLAKSLPSNSSSTIPDMVSSFVSQMTDGLDDRSIHGVSTNGHLIEPNGGVFGSSGNGSCLLHGNHYAWNNSNSHQQHPSSARIWPNSPSFVSGVQHMPAFPRVPPVMLNAVSPVHHHIGFHLGSLGNVGFPGSSPSHLVEIASHNIFSHAGGNNGVVHSPQQMCHLFPGRNPVISMPGSFESPNECQNNADDKEHSKQVYLKDASGCNKCALSRNLISNTYLPIDFKNKCNVGYAFINMIDPQQIIPFHKAFNGEKWEKFNSEKVALLAYARIQGKAALNRPFPELKLDE